MSCPDRNLEKALLIHQHLTTLPTEVFTYLQLISESPIIRFSSFGDMNPLDGSR
ncbi:MAG: hypothetical protein Q7S06_02700 [Nanoarchaeota archaeon]|nr:hypothetical protein [Nanoarchaeota archaeon]